MTNTPPLTGITSMVAGRRVTSYLLGKSADTVRVFVAALGKGVTSAADRDAASIAHAIAARLLEVDGLGFPDVTSPGDYLPFGAAERVRGAAVDIAADGRVIDEATLRAIHDAAYRVTMSRG